MRISGWSSDVCSSDLGRGPIRLMSPFITFKSCGISSKEIFLTNLPIAVSRDASGSKFPKASFLSFMVLNLMTLNILPFLPGRSCRKKTEPLLERKNKTEVKKKMGNNKMKAINRSEEHTSDLQSLMRISYAVFCLKKKKTTLNYIKLIYSSLYQI